jgi:hypothetical protein
MPVAYDSSPTALLQPERADTVFRLGPPSCLEALAVEAVRLAYLRFEASSAEHDRLVEALELVGFGAPACFDSAPSAGAGYGTVRANGLALLAFRGTQPERLRDLMTNAQFFLRPWELGPGKVHAGFRAAALGLWPALQSWLAGLAPRRGPLLICGHSLGGAIATLLALPAQASLLLTMGSPRVGDAAFVAGLQACAGLEQIRLVGCCDLIVEVPPRLLGFVHADGLRYIDGEGRIDAAPTAESMSADQARARAAYRAQFALGAGALPARELADHAPNNYLRAYYR